MMRSGLSCVAVVLLWANTSAEDLPWWKTAIFYQVYPRSFMDSDGDGVGDLIGITQKADYFTELGVDAIWLSPIFKSPMADFGYDISNFTGIDPIFGTMDDFKDLVKKLREIDVKIVLDFVPNHSSDEHPWFQQSLDNTSDYSDFYVWKNPSGYDANGTALPPNNWISVFSGSAWQWSDKRQQFYLHQFLAKQPDLNYSNPNVVSNMSEVLQFWLDNGVDGFRMDAVQHIFENSSFPDEKVISGDGSAYNDLEHIYEKNQPGTFTMLQHFADVVYKQVENDGRPRAIFLEVYDELTTVMKYYGTGTRSLEFPFNFNLLSSGSESIRPADIKTLIDDWMAAMPVDGVANWVVGNHDNIRVADRYGYEMVDAINLLTGVLPGIKVTYNGEEIGMQDTFIRWDQTQDNDGILAGETGYLSTSRDPQRTPMQWDSSISSGFSTNSTPWLPVNPNYWWLNVAAQKSADTSHLKVFKALAEARKDPVLQMGTLNVIVPDNDTLLVVRNYNSSYFVLLINMGSTVMEYNSTNLFSPQGLDIDMKIVTSSINSGYSTGKSLKKGSLSLSLKPKAAVLLSTAVTSIGSRLLGSLSVLVFALLAVLYLRR